MMASSISLSPTSPVTTTPPSQHSNTNNNKVHKPTHPLATHGLPNSTLNPRSCITCRRRKVKCDKRHPCSNCSKAHVECIFPSPGRAPRRAKKPPDAELLARLRRLESVVERLGVEVEDESDTGEGDDIHATGSQEGGPKGHLQAASQGRPRMNRPLDKEFGRLVVEEGKSRYVNNSFWATLGEEVEDLKSILYEDSDEDEEEPTPDSNSPWSGSNHQAFVLGFSSTTTSLRRFHPPPDQIFAIWQLYLENVDPMMKIFHKPTVQRQFIEASQDLDNVSKGMETLMFSIYFAVITSLSPEQCLDLMREEKQVLLAKFRWATEQALARAGFLATQEIIVLQAFVMFLFCVKRHDDTRCIWTLTGIAIRMAQSLGLHRDGSVFKLPPFETEMRRRLWWQVCLLDVRAAEDNGSDPSIIEKTFDTKLPLNVNDSDLDPDMKEPPVEPQGRTEMMFCLVRFEITKAMRKVNFPTSYADTSHETGPRPMSLSEKQMFLEEVRHGMEEKYLKYCDMNIPFYYITATLARLVLSKMKLAILHPVLHLANSSRLSPEVRDNLFITSVETLEYAYALNSEQSTQRWGWLFRSYVQWHALAFALHELCERTTGEMVDRAWRAVDRVFDPWQVMVGETRRGVLWKPVRKLMAKARAAREMALARERELAVMNMPGPMKVEPGEMSSYLTVGMPAIEATMNRFGMDFTSQPMSLGPYDSAMPLPTASQPPEQMSLGAQNWMQPMGAGPFDPQQQQQQQPFFGDLGLGEDDNMNWAGWDNMVRDFQVELDPGGPGDLSLGTTMMNGW